MARERTLGSRSLLVSSQTRRRSTSRQLAVIWGILLLTCLVSGVAAASSGSGDASNYLGRLASACSRYCHPGVGGLDLWVSLTEVCVSRASAPSVLDALQSTVGHTPPSLSGHDSNDTRWPILLSMIVCASVTTFGLFAGFMMGSARASVSKEPIYGVL